jgi:predicted MPP superfamily phosphohydrolase
MAFVPTFLARLPNLALFWLAATALWLLLVNRWLMFLVDGPIKTLVMAAALPALLAGASFASTFAAARVAPALAVGLILAGEARRVALRASYGAETAGASIDLKALSKPFTTTDLSVRYFEIDVPVLGGERLRIAHLSDLHMGDALPFDFQLEALDLARAQHPDVLVLTGDFVEGRTALPLLERWAAQAATVAPRVVYSLGNHDHWIDASAIENILDGAGMQRATGRIVPIRSDGPRVVITGTDAPWGGDAAVFDGDADVRIVLSHTADNIYDLSRRGATVVFSGHYHGGQIRLPLIGAIVVPSRYGRRFDRGRFHVGGTDLIVSSGVGAERPPLRLFCPPDVVVVDLVGRARAYSSAARRS